jgi:hypothetical protein
VPLVFSGIGRARTVTNRVRTGCAASLTPRSQFASFNGAGGIRTPAARVKSSLCCRYTTTPVEGVATFESELMLHVDLLLQSLGMELNHRSRHIRTMCFRDSTRRGVESVTRVGFEPNLASLKDWQPHQKSNGPCARTVPVSGRAEFFSERAGRRSNPSLLVFSQALNRLSYQARATKKTRCLSHDTGL